MKTSLARWMMCVAICCGMAAAQSPQAMQYAPRAIVLISGQTGVENVMPLIFTANGQQSIQFVPVSKLKEAFAQGAQPIRLGDVLSLLKQDSDKINALQAENDKLWKVATKDSPNSANSQDGLNAINCHTYDWLKNATAHQLKTCAALYPATTANYPLASTDTTVSAPEPAPLSQAQIEAQQRAQQQAQIDAEREARRQRNLLILSMALRGVSNSFAAQQQILQREQEQLQERQQQQMHCTSRNNFGTVYTDCN